MKPITTTQSMISNHNRFGVVDCLEPCLNFSLQIPPHPNMQSGRPSRSYRVVPFKLRANAKLQLSITVATHTILDGNADSLHDIQK